MKRNIAMSLVVVALVGGSLSCGGNAAKTAEKKDDKKQAGTEFNTDLTASKSWLKAWEERRKKEGEAESARSVEVVAPSMKDSEEAGALKVPVRVEVTGRLEIQGRNGSGEEVLRPQLMKTGGRRTVTLGSERGRGDGGTVTYEVGWPVWGLQKVEVPVSVRMELWGQREASTKWVTRLTPGESTMLMTATPGGDRVRFGLLLTALEEIPGDPTTRQAGMEGEAR